MRLAERLFRKLSRKARYSEFAGWKIHVKNIILPSGVDYLKKQILINPFTLNKPELTIIGLGVQLASIYREFAEKSSEEAGTEIAGETMWILLEETTQIRDELEKVAEDLSEMLKEEVENFNGNYRRFQNICKLAKAIRAIKVIGDCVVSIRLLDSLTTIHAVIPEEELEELSRKLRLKLKEGRYFCKSMASEVSLTRTLEGFELTIRFCEDMASPESWYRFWRVKKLLKAYEVR